MNQFRHILLAISLAFAPAGASAFEPDEFCGLNHSGISADLVGTWGFHQFPGMAISGAPPVPLGPVVPEPVTVRRGGSDFLLVDFPGGQVLSLQPATGGGPLPNNLPGYTDSNGDPIDVQAVTGCSWSAMPRWAGSHTFPLGGNNNMTMTIILHFPNAAFGFGVARFDGTQNTHPYAAARAIMFARGS